MDAVACSFMDYRYLRDNTYSYHKDDVPFKGTTGAAPRAISDLGCAADVVRLRVRLKSTSPLRWDLYRLIVELSRADLVNGASFCSSWVVGCVLLLAYVYTRMVSFLSCASDLGVPSSHDSTHVLLYSTHVLLFGAFVSFFFSVCCIAFVGFAVPMYVYDVATMWHDRVMMIPDVCT